MPCTRRTAWRFFKWKPHWPSSVTATVIRRDFSTYLGAFGVKEAVASFPSIATKPRERGKSLATQGKTSRKFAWSVTGVSLVSSILAPFAVLYSAQAFDASWPFITFLMVLFVLCVAIAVAASMISRRFVVPFLINIASVICLAGFAGITLGLGLLLGAVFGYSSGNPHEYVTFNTRLPRNANIVVAKNGPFGPDTKFHLIFDSSRESIEEFTRRYTGSHLDALPESLEQAFPNVSFSPWDYIPEWKVLEIENGRYYKRRTKHGNGYLFVDTDHNRVYLLR